jgi:hypothetical protein
MGVNSQVLHMAGFRKQPNNTPRPHIVGFKYWYRVHLEHFSYVALSGVGDGIGAGLLLGGTPWAVEQPWSCQAVKGSIRQLHFSKGLKSLEHARVLLYSRTGVGSMGVSNFKTHQKWGGCYRRRQTPVMSFVHNLKRSSPLAFV